MPGGVRHCRGRPSAHERLDTVRPCSHAKTRADFAQGDRNQRFRGHTRTAARCGSARSARAGENQPSGCQRYEKSTLSWMKGVHALHKRSRLCRCDSVGSYAARAPVPLPCARSSCRPGNRSQTRCPSRLTETAYVAQAKKKSHETARDEPSACASRLRLPAMHCTMTMRMDSYFGVKRLHRAHRRDGGAITSAACFGTLDALYSIA